MAWQKAQIGRAFNPQMLLAMLYQAGAEQVTFGEDSAFNGGDAVFTPVGSGQYCDGTITLTVTEE